MFVPGNQLSRFCRSAGVTPAIFLVSAHRKKCRRDAGATQGLRPHVNPMSRSSLIGCVVSNADSSSLLKDKDSAEIAEESKNSYCALMLPKR